MKTVIHIEDDHLWAAFVHQAVERQPELCFLGTATTGAEGLRRCRTMMPAVVILDLRLPDINGLALIDTLGDQASPPSVLLFTSKADDAVMARLFRKPVAGLLWKSPGCKGELQRALTTIAAGGNHYATNAKRAWRRFNAAPDSYTKILSATELELLPHFCQGSSDAEVAAYFGCALSTAHTHRKNIMAKLDLHSLMELQKWALRHGVLDPLRSAPPSSGAWMDGN